MGSYSLWSSQTFITPIDKCWRKGECLVSNRRMAWVCSRSLHCHLWLVTAFLNIVGRSSSAQTRVIWWPTAHVVQSWKCIYFFENVKKIKNVKNVGFQSKMSNVMTFMKQSWFLTSLTVLSSLDVRNTPHRHNTQCYPSRGEILTNCTSGPIFLYGIASAISDNNTSNHTF